MHGVPSRNEAGFQAQVLRVLIGAHARVNEH
jgi:hypothetical protein